MSSTVDPRLETTRREATGVAAPATHAHTLETDPAELRLLFRWLASMLFIAAALIACVWTRMAVRQTALELDAARGNVARAEIQHERLLVERALLRDPGRVAATAAGLALVPPAAVVEIRADELP